MLSKGIQVQNTLARAGGAPSEQKGRNLAFELVELASRMPTISSFYGILIRMFFNDHAPPHFHARYGEFEATIDLGTLEVIEGELPRRALSLVQERGMIHKEELLEDWRLCRENSQPAKIDPLP
jgi:hypothetical protein